VADYVVINPGYSSILSQSLTYSSYYYNLENSGDPEYYLIESIDRNFDIESFTYGQVNTVPTKSQQDVYQDALRVLAIMEYYYNSSYAYLYTYDRVILDLDEDYYNFNSSYVYYPQSTKRVYLYANYPGDYEFYGKNPLESTKDDVTINP